MASMRVDKPMVEENNLMGLMRKLDDSLRQLKQPDMLFSPPTHISEEVYLAT